MNWWDDLNEEQTERLRQLIDSRVRLIGERYATAYDACTERVTDENKKWVLG